MGHYIYHQEPLKDFDTPSGSMFRSHKEFTPAHLPIGQLSCSNRVLMLVKQPQTLQRRPVWCSHWPHTFSRLCWIAAGARLKPDPAKRAADFAAEYAMRRIPGPPVDGLCPGKNPASDQPPASALTMPSPSGGVPWGTGEW